MKKRRRGIYAVFTRHGWGDPEIEWRGAFGFLTIEDGVLLDQTSAPIATEAQPGWWIPTGSDPSFSFHLSFTTNRPEVQS